VAAVRAALGDQPGELLVAPLLGVEHPVGVLALLVPTGQVPGIEGTSLLRTLGHQAGQALERARRSDEDRSVATTLQQSMLPGALPADPRLGLSACYRPAVDRLQVGGDWFDAFALGRDRVGVVVGDVVGRGLPAAAAMGQLRSAVRALARVDSGPGALLQRLDGFVEDVPAAAMATLVYAEVDLRDGSVRFACAGHPPPVLVLPDGHATERWSGRSTPLGTPSDGSPRAEATAALPAGSRLALYSDGLVERRDRALDIRIADLTAALAARSGRPLPGLADDVADEMTGGHGTGDDVCLLLIGYRADPVAAGRGAATRSRVADLPA
jgi:serine/threonine-protein kinase RsbW